MKTEDIEALEKQKAKPSKIKAFTGCSKKTAP